jgi:hypothetical protein
MVTILLIIIGLAMLSIEIAYHASLSHSIKDLFWLTDFKVEKLKPLSEFQIWTKVGLWWLSPLALLFKLQQFFNALFNCQYCTSAQLGFWIALLCLHQGLLMSFALSGICILFVLIIEKYIM